MIRQLSSADVSEDECCASEERRSLAKCEAAMVVNHAACMLTDEPVSVRKKGWSEKLRQNVRLLPMVHTQFWIAAAYGLLAPYFPPLVSDLSLLPHTPGADIYTAKERFRG